MPCYDKHLLSVQCELRLPHLAGKTKSTTKPRATPEKKHRKRCDRMHNQGNCGGGNARLTANPLVSTHCLPHLEFLFFCPPNMVTISCQLFPMCPQ